VRFRSGGGPSTRFMSSAVLIALTAIVLAAALVIVAWKYGGASDTGVVPPPKTTKKHTTTHRRHRQVIQPTTAQTGVRLVVKAAKGDSWLEVHKGDPTGTVEYQGTLLRGQSQIFTNRRLWLTIDAPANVVVKLNNVKQKLAAHGPVNYSLGRTGLKQAS
jgi:hypothetical protein